MSFTRYPNYKDSGVEWLGEVPGHWKVTRLSYVTEILAGHSFDAALFGFDGVPVIRMSDFGDGRVYLDDAKMVEPLHVPDRSLAQSGDVLLGLSGSISNFAIVREQDLPVAINQRVAMVRLHDSKSSIVKWFLQSAEFSNQLVSVLPETTIQNISMGQLRGCNLPFPPLPEQTQIAAFLDRETAKIDALVAEQRRLMELLKEKRQAVISHAVTQGLNPHAPMKPSGIEWLGDVPAHWSLPRLKEVASFCGGGTPSRENLTYWNGDIPWVSPKDMKTERIVGSEESITEIGLRNSSSNLLSAGRVLMVVRSGILQHTIPVAINQTAVALNQDMKALEFDSQRVFGEFFMRWVQGLNDLLLLAWAKQGATVESIEQSYLANTVIPMPNLPEQTEIIEFLGIELAKFDTLTAEANRAIDLLQERRTALISAAVTGQIDVRGVVQ